MIEGKNIRIETDNKPKELNFYVGGKCVGKSNSITVHPVSFKWEYYCKRCSKYYFRNNIINGVFVVDGKDMVGIDKLKRGEFYDVEINT